MPLIRYDTGDLGVSAQKAGEITTLDTLHGRVAGQLTSVSGARVSNVMMAAITEPFTSIVKYQMIQKPNHFYVFKFVGTLDDTQKQEILGRFKDSFGDGEFVFENVEDISVGKNGKFQTSINETL